ncbi:MAG TPA: DUF371 domain-containing protein [Archaeoglobus veneficus]|nr:DUF371 domain-containing protein [Archaeoglobus veneficus]
MFSETVEAWGHPNITALHKTTFEVTKDSELSKRGDCIIGVRANKAIRDLNENLKEMLKLGYKAKITLELPDYGIKDEIVGLGNEKMSFKHKKDIVVRKSNYVCDRTLLIKATKSAFEIDREMIKLLKDPSTRLILKIEIIND